MIIVINKYEKGWKLCRGKRKLRDWKKTRLIRKMDETRERSCYWIWIFKYFLQHFKILAYIPRHVPFDLDTWKFIT